MSHVYELECKWLKFVQNILNECDMPYIWNTQTFINSNWIVNEVKLSLKDKFKQSKIHQQPLFIDKSRKHSNLTNI